MDNKIRLLIGVRKVFAFGDEVDELAHRSVTENVSHHRRRKWRRNFGGLPTFQDRDVPLNSTEMA